MEFIDVICLLKWFLHRSCKLPISTSNLISSKIEFLIISCKDSTVESFPISINGSSFWLPIPYPSTNSCGSTFYINLECNYVSQLPLLPPWSKKPPFLTNLEPTSCSIYSLPCPFPTSAHTHSLVFTQQ